VGRDNETYLGAAAREGAEGEAGADEQGAFAHAADAGAFRGAAQAAAVVADA
jgi:hypothetical protein